MAVGIIIHITVGREKRTEFFSEERIRIGADESCDLQIRADRIEAEGVWVELEFSGDAYRVINFKPELELTVNGTPMRRFIAVRDGDAIAVGGSDISFSFFSISTKPSLVSTRLGGGSRERPVAPFIENAAIEAALTPKRDDAKVFLREFVRELAREISWTTKIIILILASGFIGGILYLGFAFNKELRKNRLQAEQQHQVIEKLQEQLARSNEQLGKIDESNEQFRKMVSLMQNVRVEYGNGVCLIVGKYDLVDRTSGKTLRYPAPVAVQPDPYEPTPQEGEETPAAAPQMQMGLTTEGNGSPVEYDFIGTGFHVGGGFIVTNRHVLQPWEEDDMVKQMMSQSNGKARVKSLVIYFPNLPKPFPLRTQQVGFREDLGVATIDPNMVSPDIPVLPLDAGSDAVAVGKTVVTMGFPNGPERLLAMVDDAEARSIQARFGNSRQALLNYLAQTSKIVPLTTQGSITDLDARRIVHDAKTAEGGSGAPLFGQSGKVIGVNFGVFTENTAANMAVPIRYALDLLRRAGWKSPDETSAQQQKPSPPVANTNTTAAQKPQP